MARSKIDPQIRDHLEWIGFVRPTGLVVSAPALVRAGAILNQRDIEGQRLLRDCVTERVFDPKEAPAPYLPDFRRFAESVLGWTFSPKAYAGTAECPIPSELDVAVEGLGETLRPDFAVSELEPRDDASPWQLLVKILDPGDDFDRVVRGQGHLDVSAHGRMERLLRLTGVPAGLLFNGRALRLVSAPKGESSGWLDFRVAEMFQTAGRPISTALRLLLGQRRLLSLPRAQRFAALLEDSRKFQNEVSEKLAEQVLHALYELLRGLQAAHDRSKGEVLREPLTQHPDEVYRGLLTVILRLVFLLYAEERDMLPEDETFLRHYSLAGLHEHLREDAALFPDTMDQRYGAWAQLLALFRMIYDGAESGSMRLPRRHGALFDPDRFPFLEGRSSGAVRQIDERIEPPLVPDGTIYRALEKLLVLDGERISYRALDVEQIGSVYETMMGFRLETATGRSIAIKAQKKHGAPTAVDLEALLAESAAKRAKWIQDRAGRKITDTVKKVVTAAASLEDLHAALLPVIDLAATPDLVSKHAMVLQPSEERRRSGSHYTPRSLTEPIVRTTLEPILAPLRGDGDRPPRPDQILELKVCDPAMGSGAFLVEACRQLGDALVEAWRAHDEMPAIPPDEDEVIFARRLIAQRCLYGVDKNPVAVDLAKVSLWLATLARDHAFTFLDHSFRCGDSLVGLTAQQIAAMHWQPGELTLFEQFLRDRIRRVTEVRQSIMAAREDTPYRLLEQKLGSADDALNPARWSGDAVVAAFFEAEKTRDRETKRLEYAVLHERAERGDLEADEQLRQVGERLAAGPNDVTPFNWEIEFPEVFQLDDRLHRTAGFDAIVGNPPFLGGKRISTSLGSPYRDWLLETVPESNVNGDLVAFFFRKGFTLLRELGSFGLIATNTIGQAETRSTGLEWICLHGGAIYAATRRIRWPGSAAVVVSVVHVYRGRRVMPPRLDGVEVPKITAYLFHAGEHSEPKPLAENSGKSFLGSIILGMGFTFDDAAPDASPLAVMLELLEKNPKCKDVIVPYIGGEEVNTSPELINRRCVINFGRRSLAEVRSDFPELLNIVTEKVRPARASLKRAAYRDNWWLFAEPQHALYEAIASMTHVFVTCRVSPYLSIAKVPARMVFSESLVVFPSESSSDFSVLQSRSHETWARFFGSSMKDDLRYSPTKCFRSFPLPRPTSKGNLTMGGEQYHNFRSALMHERGLGLTAIYNRFHDPEERDPEILKLRELHAAMDRAVLDAYSWSDISTDCEFLLDYEIDEEEWGRKKKPWRYRWPDNVRDEVLARLIELNAERAKEEVRSGAAAAPKKRRKKATRRSPQASGMKDLFS